MHNPNLSPSLTRKAGCICEFGCRNCGLSEAQMGNCPAWDPCPMGRENNPDCPLNKEEPWSASPTAPANVAIPPANAGTASSSTPDPEKE